MLSGLRQWSRVRFLTYVSGPNRASRLWPLKRALWQWSQPCVLTYFGGPNHAFWLTVVVPGLLPDVQLWSQPCFEKRVSTNRFVYLDSDFNRDHRHSVLKTRERVRSRDSITTNKQSPLSTHKSCALRAQITVPKKRIVDAAVQSLGKKSAPDYRRVLCQEKAE
jgi:hypothetical protein